MSEEVREIYLEAIIKLHPLHIYDAGKSDEDLRLILMDYSEGVRQTKESRIARKALKDAAYARLNGSK